MYYGLNKYGQSNYAENIPSTEELIDHGYFVDLTKYVPPVVWKKSIINKAIYKTQGIELGLLYYYLEDLKNLPNFIMYNNIESLSLLNKSKLKIISYPKNLQKLLND